jgi:hypothetical protein
MKNGINSMNDKIGKSNKEHVYIDGNKIHAPQKNCIYHLKGSHLPITATTVIFNINLASSIDYDFDHFIYIDKAPWFKEPTLIPLRITVNASKFDQSL